jgi:hypothetical protein
MGLVISTNLLLLLIHARMKGGRGISAEFLIMWLTLFRVKSTNVVHSASARCFLQVMMTSLSI